MKNLLLGAIWLAVVAPLAAQKQGAHAPDIPYERFVLENGLTLIVHEDHKAPIVAVNVWYHVGSKNEKPGKSGFAHLFEHLMFNGSENYDKDYFQVMEAVGATDLNGTTNEDRTNYFQNVPTSALDLALWMESDRMGHLLGAISQAKLDEQRGVVQNEKRQGENQPYAVSYELIVKATYPAGHPYSWTVIGSMEDLNAASLDDVKEWFKTYYGAANAVIVLAGDITAGQALEKVKAYFGDIPSGPPIARHDSWIARRTGTHRQLVQDRVPQPRIYKVWNMPPWGTRDANYLDLVSDVLALGKTSRLYKRLVYDDQIASDVQSYVDLREISSQFYIEATAKPGVELSKVEKAVDEELARLLADGPTQKEMERVKTLYVARFVRGIERIGGFGGKSDILAISEVFGGSPDYYKTNVKDVQGATAADLHKAAKDWLSDGQFVLEVHPFPKYTTSTGTVDRARLPEVGVAPDAQFPKLQRATLSNGLKVILAEMKSVPVVSFDLLVDAGFAADQEGIAGTASLAMNMLDEGTKTRDALQISEELAMLGAELGTGSNLDLSNVSLSALKTNLDASLAIFADVILNPSFPDQDFQRLKQQQVVRIQQEKTAPFSMAQRVLPKLLYGGHHAYSNPLTGSGYEEGVDKISREDLVRFHQTWFHPNNATLVVVGDIAMKDLTPRMERLFKGWAAGDTPKKNLGQVALPAESVVYVLDKPGAQQSVILAMHLAPPSGGPDEIAIETFNNILGGDFTSRVNMNLRENKHWSYGVRSMFMSARGQRPFLVVAPVQFDKTRESMAELNRELREFVGDRPLTQPEFDKARNNQVLQMPGQWETMRAVGNSIGDIVRFNLPDDYFDGYPLKTKNLKLDETVKAARATLHPDRLIWVVIGDREKIEAGVRELGLGDVHFIDGDGNVIK